MGDDLTSILLGTSVLTVIAVVALTITVRDARHATANLTGTTAERIARRAFAVAILVQSSHFAEELTTGFHLRWPTLLGLRPWSTRFFIAFNLCWIAIWLLACARFRAGSRTALFAAWFLAIGLMANAVAHPLLAAATRGYFPGLWTSPFCGAAGLWLSLRLHIATREEPIARVRNGS